MSEQVAPYRELRPLRRLLPLPAKRPLSHAESSTAQPHVASQRPKTGRAYHNQVAAACDACRKQKSKCHGERPSCRRCVRRQVPCQYTAQPGETQSQALRRAYDDLRDRATAQEEIFNLLVNLPDHEAQYVLRNLRSGTDIATMLDHIKAGNLLLQLAVTPETRFRYTFPYRSDMFENDVSTNPYLGSLIFDAAPLYSSDQYSQLPGSTSSSSGDTLSRVEYRSLYQTPFHAAQVVDTRLFDANPSMWTTVCSDDALMRDLLGVWLRCEYHFTAAFQKDLFLEDMAAQREDFCSSLLVNIVLAYSCVCNPRFTNRAEYWNPHTLLYRFLAEAKRLWELESAEARVTTIQAGMLLNVFYNLCGLDEIGQGYRMQAIILANKLHLYDGPIQGESSRVRHGKLFVAWALYSWETLTAFSFMNLPELRSIPHEPLPDPSEHAHWYGEIWVRYPLNQSLSPSYFGHVFKARCLFRIILNEFCYLSYSKDSTMTLDKANELYSRLRAWYESLPEPLLPGTIVLPGHLQLHIYYQNLLLALFEPLLDSETDQTPSPRDIVAVASRYLQTLVRVYYLRHGFDAMDLFIVIPLILVGFNCIEAINKQSSGPELHALRSMLMLISTGLYSQRRNHHLAEALFRVIRGRMRPPEAGILRSMLNLDKTKEEKQAPMQAVRSQWPVSIVKEQKDPEADLLKNLVENYANMNVEDEGRTAQESQ